MDIRENQHGEFPGQERKTNAAYPFDDDASMTTALLCCHSLRSEYKYRQFHESSIEMTSQTANNLIPCRIHLADCLIRIMLQQWHA